jgi:hypothetical protein
MFRKFKLGDIVRSRIFAGDILVTSKEDFFCKAIFINGRFDGARLIIMNPDLYDVVGNISDLKKGNGRKKGVKTICPRY